jgi:3alpha(or 20beta)-hydroxysteroid dehydrogenase
MNRLEGKVALITGGGQGEAEARRFVAEGARVVIADVLDDAGHRVAAELGDAARYQHLDVTNEDDWHTAVHATLAHFGRLDILVNNAAILKLVPIESCSLDDYRKEIDVNQVGCWLGMKSALAALKDAGGGSIVNVSSTAGMEGVAGGSAYVSSKFAVRGMTKAAALEFGRYGIPVNSVHPGGIDTVMALRRNTRTSTRRRSIAGYRSHVSANPTKSRASCCSSHPTNPRTARARNSSSTAGCSRAAPSTDPHRSRHATRRSVPVRLDHRGADTAHEEAAARTVHAFRFRIHRQQHEIQQPADRQRTGTLRSSPPARLPSGPTNWPGRFTNDSPTSTGKLPSTDVETVFQPPERIDRTRIARRVGNALETERFDLRHSAFSHLSPAPLVRRYGPRPQPYDTSSSIFRHSKPDQAAQISRIRDVYDEGEQCFATGNRPAARAMRGRCDGDAPGRRRRAAGGRTGPVERPSGIDARPAHCASCRSARSAPHRLQSIHAAARGGWHKGV